jgi:hypothetical protein
MGLISISPASMAISRNQPVLLLDLQSFVNQQFSKLLYLLV